MSRTAQPGPAGPTTTEGSWGLRYPGLAMSADGKNEVKEFTGMWALKPDADLVALTSALAPGGWITPPGESKLGPIRTARWYVARTQYFDGCTMFFSSQFDGSLETFLDDFMLSGKENLLAIWGQCVGCPDGPEVTAREVVEYVARGQILTLACYDAVPGMSIPQIHRAVDWYEKTQKFQLAIARGDGAIEDDVETFLRDLVGPAKAMPSAAMIDAEVAREWQYEDLADVPATNTGRRSRQGSRRGAHRLPPGAAGQGRRRRDPIHSRPELPLPVLPRS